MKQAALRHHHTLHQQQHQYIQTHRGPAQAVLDQAEQEDGDEGQQVGPVDAPVVDSHQAQPRRDRGEAWHRQVQNAEKHEREGQDERRKAAKRALQPPPGARVHCTASARPTGRVEGSAPGKT